jgi:hypothetical protein
MPHICATKSFSAITNHLFSMALLEHASGLAGKGKGMGILGNTTRATLAYRRKG